jgi:hypothetical protein
VITKVDSRKEIKENFLHTGIHVGNLECCDWNGR